MDPRERRDLLERIDRNSTLGREIPERITVQGSEVAPREFVFEGERHETIPSDGNTFRRRASGLREERNAHYGVFATSSVP